MHSPCIPFSKNPNAKVSFPYKGGTHFIHPDQIIRLEADSNYTYIHVQDRRPLLMAKVLADYENLLEPFGFIRTHRSHLINRIHIAGLDIKGCIVMDDSSVAEISRRKRKLVLQLFPFTSQVA